MPDLESNGIHVYFEETGIGDPVILIMGITARGSVWAKHAECWRNQFRLIMPDNRGVGSTDKPAGPYSTAQMADDYIGLMDGLGINQAHVVGCSMGSTIAQQIALRAPSRVRSMVLMCSWARCDAMTRAIFEHMVDCKARLRPDEFTRYIQLLIYSKQTWDNPALLDELLEARAAACCDPFPQPLHGLEAQAAACIGHNTLAVLPQTTCPTLVIGGSEDRFTPKWMMEEIAAAIPHAALHVYEGAGHAFHWERIDDFNPRVAAWLAAQSRGARKWK